MSNKLVARIDQMTVTKMKMNICDMEHKNAQQNMDESGNIFGNNNMQACNEEFIYDCGFQKNDMNNRNQQQTNTHWEWEHNGNNCWVKNDFAIEEVKSGRGAEFYNSCQPGISQMVLTKRDNNSNPNGKTFRAAQNQEVTDAGEERGKKKMKTLPSHVMNLISSFVGSQ